MVVSASVKVNCVFKLGRARTFARNHGAVVATSSAILHKCKITPSFGPKLAAICRVCLPRDDNNRRTVALANGVIVDREGGETVTNKSKHNRVVQR